MIDARLYRYLLDYSSPLSPLLQELFIRTTEEVDKGEMISGPLVSSLLRLFARLTGAERILDLGTFTGFSALSLAEGTSKNGKVITADVNEDYLKIAKRYFEKHPDGSKISVFHGPAATCIEQTREEVDLAFIDADKSSYPFYYDSLLPKLRRGGVLLFDDTLRKGGVVDPKKIGEKKMHAFNERISREPGTEHLLLPIRNGIHVVYKL